MELLVSVLTSGTDQTHHVYYDFTGGIKPHLLTEIDNHGMGALARIRLRSIHERIWWIKKTASHELLPDLPFSVNLIGEAEIVQSNFKITPD